MLKNNKIWKVILKLSFKHFFNLKYRNLIAVIAIILTTVLFTSFFTISLGIIDSFQEQNLKQTNNTAHAMITGTDMITYETLKSNKKYYDKIGYQMIVSTDILNDELIDMQVGLMNFNDEGAKMNCCYPSIGKMPEGKNDIVVNTRLLKKMNLSREIGQKIILDYSIKGKIFHEGFNIVGYWENSEISDLNFILVSKDFVNSKKDLLNFELDVNPVIEGSLNILLAFDNYRNIDKNVEKLLKFSDVDDLNYIVNWAYISNNDFLTPKTLVFTSIFLLLFLFAGYLIINTIFEISIVNDINFWGQLKSISCSDKQIRKIVYLEVLYLCIFGIFIGNIVGYLIGSNLLPMVLNITEIENFKFDINPIIFVFSSFFAFLTVFISIRKPAKKASNISVLTAIKCIEGQV